VCFEGQKPPKVDTHFTAAHYFALRLCLQHSSYSLLSGAKGHVVARNVLRQQSEEVSGGRLSLVSIGTILSWEFQCLVDMPGAVDTDDKVPATEEIAPVYKRVHFGSTISYDEKGQPYRPKTDPPYVGDSSPEIEEAWKSLQGGKLMRVVCPTGPS